MRNDVDGLRDKPRKDEPFKENHLKSVLDRLFPDYEWVYNKGIKDSTGKCFKSSSGKKFFPDAHCVELKLAIEVDGDSITFRDHFSKEYIAEHDLERDMFYRNLGYTVIAIPFYVQLDEDMVFYYFEKYKPQNKGKLYEAAAMHGFMHSQATLPIDFCQLGRERFEKDMKELPLNVRKYIVKTLKERVQLLRKQGKNDKEAINAVIPNELQYILDIDTESIEILL